MAFVNSTRNQDFFAQVAIPPENVDTEGLGAQDYQVKEVVLGRPTRDTTKLMVTMGIKEVLKKMEQDEEELCTLHRKIEILRGYLAKVVGPLDHKHPEETLNTILREGVMHIDPFFKAF